jgi:EAL domain-containing protein (putative c-di-GMP-specific phosphodiesterase class I)/ActR/RegA family two-component response regulator
MPSEVILVVDDDRDLLGGLGAVLRGADRAVVLCRDLESARLVIDTYPVTHVLSDIRLTGPFNFEGLGLSQYVRERSPETFVILMTGSSTEALEAEARNRGSIAFLAKPFSVDEVEAIIAGHPCSRPGKGPLPELMEMPLLDEFLDSEALYPIFQPIHRLSVSPQPPFGFECLTRLATESAFRDPSLLFRYAADKGRVTDLELACIRRACRAATALEDPTLLFVNIHPAVLSDGERLLAALQESVFPVNRIVLEITEQSPIRAEPAVWRTIEQLTRQGVRFAFDDVGMAYSHFEHMARVRPAFLKISQNFGTGFESDHVNETIVRSVLQLANHLSVQLILEGIETEATLARAIELAIPLGQGYLLGRPAPLAQRGR